MCEEDLIPTILLLRDDRVCGCIVLLSGAMGMTKENAQKYCAERGFDAQFQEYWSQING